MLLGILNWLRGLRPSSIRTHSRTAQGRAAVKTSELLSLIPECLLTDGKLKGTYLSSDPCERAAAYHLGYRAVCHASRRDQRTGRQPAMPFPGEE